MAHVFVMTNHKGGVGKSTTATNTAFGIVRLLENAGAPNSRVLIIDTDSQGHATLITTGRNDFDRNNSLYSVISAEREQAAAVMTDCIVPSTWDNNLHVLPASTLLEAAERELIGVPGAPYRMAHPLKRIISHYAAVVIDTRPSFSLPQTRLFRLSRAIWSPLVFRLWSTKSTTSAKAGSIRDFR